MSAARIRRGIIIVNNPTFECTRGVSCGLMCCAYRLSSHFSFLIKVVYSKEFVERLNSFTHLENEGEEGERGALWQELEVVAKSAFQDLKVHFVVLTV